MRVVIIALLALCAAPAWGQGIGGSSQQTTTTTQTTTTKTQDGDSTTTTTTTRSETTSSGGGFSFGNLFGGNGSAGTAAPSYENTGGKWKIGEAQGSKMCDLTLEKTKFISNYGARTGIGCPEGLFGVSSWMLAGDEIRLLSPAGSVLATLRPGRGGRWIGRTTQGLEIFIVRD